MKTRQTAIETVLKKFIASEEDWDHRDPDEKRKIVAAQQIELA